MCSEGLGDLSPSRSKRQRMPAKLTDHGRSRLHYTEAVEIYCGKEALVPGCLHVQDNHVEPKCCLVWRSCWPSSTYNHRLYRRTTSQRELGSGTILLPEVLDTSGHHHYR